MDEAEKQRRRQHVDPQHSPGAAVAGWETIDERTIQVAEKKIESFAVETMTS
jgi:hypothetical protein